MPSVPTKRMRALPIGDVQASVPTTATPVGLFSLVPGCQPPVTTVTLSTSSRTLSTSPPATVVMMPSVPTQRMRLLLESAMYRLPSPPTATPVGLFSLAWVASPRHHCNPEYQFPNPEYQSPCHGGDDAVSAYPADAIVTGISDVQASVPTYCVTLRKIQSRLGC